MIGLDTSAAAKRRAADRVVLVGLPVWLTWLSLGYFNSRPEALAIGVGLGAPLALATVRLANGWGIQTAEDAEEPRDA